MVGSVGGSGGATLLAAVMKEAAAVQDVEIALIKKSQDIEKANGESALKLIASASAASGAEGIDIYV